ncbi:probable V-type proton ATPase subunit e1 [Coccomyxa sp. Obi]|nr:probable V-type proton ATPase subunit e1 [Coccomyxa sp. Obi]
MASAFWGVTGFFIVLEIAMALGVVFAGGKKDEKQLRHLLCILAVVCCWLLWCFVYIAQMHPLVRPVLQST